MKKNLNDYTIIPAKCSQSKEMFGIRGIRHNGTWHLTWAFKMTERQAKGEHIENNTLSGNAAFDATYPKCPYCGKDSILMCQQCGHVSCLSGTGLKDGINVTCAWCGFSSKGRISNDITGTKSGAF